MIIYVKGVLSMRMIDVEVRCPICGKSYIITVPYEGFRNWQDGGRIQRCLPTLSNEDRESLMTGICGDCWDKLYGEDD